MSVLFRKQALEHKYQSLQGVVLVLPRLSHNLMVAALLLWVALLSLWLSCSSYARKETVIGWLDPPEGVIKIYPEGTGVITQLLVAEGEVVAKGQPLLVISDDRQLLDGTQLEESLIEEYQQQDRLLSQQLQREKAMYTKRELELTQRVSAAKQDLSLLDQQIGTMKQRLALASQQLQDLTKLVQKGHAASIDENRKQEQQLSLFSEFQSLERNRINQANRLQQLQSELTLLPDNHNNSLDQLDTQLSVIRSERTKINARKAYVVKASKAGVVNNLTAQTGKRPNNIVPLLSIVPENAHLIVHLLVPIKAAGFVRQSQSIDIRYDAFPYQKFGLYQGTISNVSSAVILPNELLDHPVKSPEPVYRVEAQLASATVGAYQKTFPLKAGMTLSADITLENRSVFQWLLEPIHSLRGRL